MVPAWLDDLAKVSLVAALVSALLIVWDIVAGHGQKMRIMNFVWPITALYFGPFTHWSCWRYGWPSALSDGGEKDAVYAVGSREKQPKSELAYTTVGVTHCGAGCTLGDLVAEWVLYLTGFAIAGSALWPRYIFDYAGAFLLGILFQYFSIAPMRGLRGWSGIKADSASITAFQIGLFGWMAITYLRLFPEPHLRVPSAAFWFLMQVGMVIGFATAMPVNWLLIKYGVKERM